jgi:hypothetical protein
VLIFEPEKSNQAVNLKHTEIFFFDIASIFSIRYFWNTLQRDPIIIDADPVTMAYQMRTGEHAHLISLGHQDLFQIIGHRTFAVGAGNMNCLNRILWIPSSLRPA